MAHVPDWWLFLTAAVITCLSLLLILIASCIVSNWKSRGNIYTVQDKTEIWIKNKQLKQLGTIHNKQVSQKVVTSQFHNKQINLKKMAHTSSGIIVSILNRRFSAVEGSMPGTVPGSNMVIMSCMAVVQSCWIVWMTYAPNCK